MASGNTQISLFRGEPMTAGGQPIAASIPAESQLVPFPDSENGPGLRLCLLIRTTPDPVNGYLFRLRDFAGTSVFLGCLVDQEKHPHAWYEIWVQNSSGLNTSEGLPGSGLSAEARDLIWGRQCDFFGTLFPEGILKTGWESTHPRPLFYDVNGQRLVYTDTPSPPNEQNEPFSLVPVNPEGGLMMVTPFFPLSYDEGVELLGGRPWKEIEDPQTSFTLGTTYRRLEQISADGRGYGFLYWGAHEQTGRLMEILHLKLHLLASAFRAVRACVEQQDLPLLNISSDSFRLRLHPSSGLLPFLWTLELAPAKTGQTVRVRMDQGGGTRFLRFGEAYGSDYFISRGKVSIRTISPVDSGKVILQGTLRTSTNLHDYSKRDLLEITIPVKGRAELFHAHVVDDPLLPKDSYSFETLPRPGNDDLYAAHQAAPMGFPPREFKIIPIISAPCDLNALALLAVRTLLVAGSATLNEAFDDVQQLGQTIRQQTDVSGELSERIRALLEKDAENETPSWVARLGPHRLVYAPLDQKTSFKLVPATLWAEILALILQLQPGLMEESFCEDDADAPPENLAALFDQPIEKLEKLLIRTRSLLLVDWSFNREINRLVNELIKS